MLRIMGRLSILSTAIIITVFIFLPGKTYPQEIPQFQGTLLTELLLDVTDSLANSTVAAVDTHKVGFLTTLTSVGNSSIVWITFPGGFDITGITNILYSDDDISNDGNEPSFNSWQNLGQTLKCSLGPGDQPAVPGSRISIRILDVLNTAVAGDYTVQIFITDSLENLTHGPGESQVFTLNPEPFDHIVLTPGNDTSIAAGSSIYFNAVGYDEFNNIISGLTFT